jgi:hypothetical protein
MRVPTLVALCAAALLATVSGVAAQERFGGIAGVVVDPSKAAVPGATITVTNSQTGAVRTTVSGPDGSFRISDLDPGRYNVVVELQGFQKVQADNVLVLLGRTLDFPAELRVGALTETVNVTAEASRQIDLSSVTIAHNVTAEEFDRIPKTRTFQGIAFASPSVNQGQIEGGIQVNGASGAENAYTVDGVVTNSLVNGSARQNTVFEYLQEVQVKTTGISAEYGGALGGVISAVTKSGGNRFTGEGHYYYQGSGLSAAPVRRLVLDPRDELTVGYFQDQKQPDHQQEFGGSVGGPIVQNRAFFYGSFSPRIVRQQNEYGFSNGAELGTVDRDQTQMQAFGKLTFSTDRMTAHGSLLYTPTTTTGVLPAYDGPGAQFLGSTLASVEPNKTRGWEIDQTNAAGNLDIVLSSSALLTARGGYFYDSYKDTGIPNVTSTTYQTTAIGLPFAIPANLIGPTNTFNTPRAQITSFDTTKRGFFNVDYLQTWQSAGTHTFKGGLGYQRTINDVDSRYPGGYVFVFWNSAFSSNVTGITDRGQFGYYEVNDFGTFGKVGANIISLYAQDQWSVTPRLTLNLGLRTENEQVPNMGTGEQAFEFSFADKLAPRLGATYDVRGDGRMKVYGSWGRYFDWTKYELSRGSFGGDFWRIYYRSLDTLDVFNLNIDNKPGRDLWGSATGFRNRRVNFAGNVDPDIKPMYQDSTSIGWEYQAYANTVFSVHFVHNDLGRTIEDIGALDPNGDEAYVIGNPGEFLSEFEAPSGRTPPGQPMPKARRQYNALEFAVSRRFSQNWFVSGNYTWSRLYGNYSGISSSDEIRTPTTTVTSPSAQQQAGNVFRQGGNANRAWDIDYLNWDSHGNHDVVGRLATDRPHVLKLYGSYQFNFGTQVGAFFYGASGTPISTYVITTDQIPVFVNGRGDLGRTSALTRTDFLVSHEFAVNGARNQRIRLELNVLNVFNQKTATHFYNQVNRGPSGLPRQASAIDLHGVNLLQGYDYRALLAATADGANALDPRFMRDDLFNPGGLVKFRFK